VHRLTTGAILSGMQVQIRRISLRSVFLVTMALNGIVGFLVGLILAIVATVDVPAGTEPNLLSRLGIWSVVVFPLNYGIGAGFLGAIAAALYNAVASLVGGFRVEIPDLQPRWEPNKEPGKEPE
jgi:ABC-type multidrug transport system permease subunit